MGNKCKQCKIYAQKKKRRHAMRTEDHHIVLALMAIPWITTGKSKQIDPKYKGNDKKKGYILKEQRCINGSKLRRSQIK